jgi:hypothetical protein
LQLWAFTENRSARASDASLGAVELSETDGGRDEERAPDLHRELPA